MGIEIKINKILQIKKKASEYSQNFCNINFPYLINY